MKQFSLYNKTIRCFLQPSSNERTSQIYSQPSWLASSQPENYKLVWLEFILLPDQSDLPFVWEANSLQLSNSEAACEEAGQPHTYQSFHSFNYLSVTLAFEQFNFKFGS